MTDATVERLQDVGVMGGRDGGLRLACQLYTTSATSTARST